MKLEKALKKIGKEIILPIVTGIYFVCGPSCGPEENNYPRDLHPWEIREIEERKIEEVYRSWSSELKMQNFEGALRFCVPNSNCQGRTEVHKQTWDEGGQSYDTFSYLEGWVTDEWLERGYAEAVGNGELVVRGSQYGDRNGSYGLYSSLQNYEGDWKIDGINSNGEPDWWRK